MTKKFLEKGGESMAHMHSVMFRRPKGTFRSA